MNDNDKITLADDLLHYCNKFDIPINFLFEILEDQKVTPMIRGKAMEYNAFLLLNKVLQKNTWSVQKLNLNAQTGINDEDISITHRRTGIILKVESKSAVRGSITDGVKSRTIKEPHFKVKCHRSRSNIKLAGTSNDRYSVDSFDLLLTNTANAIYQGNTVGEELEIVHNERIKHLLFDFYQVKSKANLIIACQNDWRFAIPSEIAIDGFIPRTPYVKLFEDKNWWKVDSLEDKLMKIIEQKRITTRRN